MSTPVNFEECLTCIKASFPKMKPHLQRFWAGCARDSGQDVLSYARDLKSRFSEARKDDKELRAMLREKYGKGCYRIKKDDTVDVYGKMPRSIVTGWYYLGEIEYVRSSLKNFE